jgi:hypothetical protein
MIHKSSTIAAYFSRLLESELIWVLIKDKPDEETYFGLAEQAGHRSVAEYPRLSASPSRLENQCTCTTDVY